MPYRRNSFFTGREDVLDRLRAALTAGHTTALTQALQGLGGVGKTQTAVEYAYRHKDDYRTILWARADTATTLDADFARFAALLGLPEKDARDPDAIREAVKRWLDREEGYLLVLDNVDDPPVVKPFLPLDPRGHILITSRAHNLDKLNVLGAANLEEMPEDEAVHFLFKRVRRQDDDPAERAAAEALARELGYLPLALEQAAAYIAVHDTRFQDYLDGYRKRRLDLLKKHGPVAGDYRDTVQTTWKTSFDAIKAESVASADLLTFSAFLGPDRIPFVILVKGASELGDTLAAALAGADVASQALNELLTPLTGYSLIRRGRGESAHTYDIHRMVQAVIQDELDATARCAWAERAVRAVNLATPYIEFTNWPDCERLLSHWSVCADHVGEHGMKSEEAARLLNQAGYYLKERARYAMAEPLLRRALAICEQALVPDHSQAIFSLSDLAEFYHSQGRFVDAEPLLRRARDIQERKAGPDHPDTATTLNDMARLHLAQGQHAKAEPLLLRALAIREQKLGDDPRTAFSLYLLATLYCDQCRYAEAELLHRRALAIREQKLVPDHPRTAISLNKLAGLLRIQGRYTEAESLSRRALAIRERALGRDHPETASSLNNLAELYRAQGRYAEAEPLYRRALAIREQALGADHPNTAQVFENYAVLLRSMGRDDEASELGARAKASRDAHARRNAT